jgi:4-hydroxybenzoate polyprenyltransferase
LKKEDTRSGLQPWLALLRLPNLFTIPGDVVVGYLIAESQFERIDLVLGYSFTKWEFASYAFLPALASVLSIYCYGLISNDLADYEEDSEERPERPLPSGRISLRAAKSAAFALLALGLGFAKLANDEVFVLACSLAALVASYNFFLKRFDLLGPLALAACRVMSLLAGYLACGAQFSVSRPPPFLLAASAVWGFYIFAVSTAARSETKPAGVARWEIGTLRMIPYLQLFWFFAGLFIGGGVAAVEAAGEHPPGVLLALFLAVMFPVITLYPAHLIASKERVPETTSKSIGILIRSLITLQASACAFLGYPYAALAVLSLWIPAKIAGIHFKGS